MRLATRSQPDRNQIATSDQNVITQGGQRITLPPPESVDIKAEVAELRTLLAALAAPDAGKIERALADAEEEVQKDAPDKDEVGNAIERAVKYAKGASDFSAHVEKLTPRLAAIGGWLGENWQRLLGGGLT